jgi:chromosome partitioning protein
MYWLSRIAGKEAFLMHGDNDSFVLHDPDNWNIQLDKRSVLARKGVPGLKVVVVGNLKGGVGKSTISCNLGVAAALDGKKTLIIDSDPQNSSMTFRSVRQSGNLKAVSIILPTIHKNIREFTDFDLVIVDAGGRDSALFRSAIIAATDGILIVPILSSQYDIWATEDTFAVLKEARGFKKIRACVLFNQVMQNTTINKDALETLQEMTGENAVSILTAKLYNRVDYKKSISEGKGVMEYAPRSKAAQEVRALYEEVMQLLNAGEGVTDGNHTQTAKKRRR